jgi:hypothetical protein
LGDEMGLGKTMEILGLISCSKTPSHHLFDNEHILANPGDPLEVDTMVENGTKITTEKENSTRTDEERVNSKDPSKDIEMSTNVENSFEDMKFKTQSTMGTLCFLVVPHCTHFLQC